MKIGSKKVDNDVIKRIRPKDMNTGEILIVRVVNGPIKRHIQMWPTVQEDRNTGTMKNTWRSVIVSRDEANILDKLANIDIHLKRQFAEKVSGEDPKSIRKSTVTKNDRYDFAVLRRKPGEPVEATIMEANWAIFNEITNIQNAKYPLDQSKLHHGMSYMYDITIQKTRNPKTGQNAYLVNTMGCTTEGKIPAIHLDEAKFPYPTKEEFFSAEDLEVLGNAKWELEELDLPVSADDVLAKLREFPIDLSRKETKDASKFIFFQCREDLEAILQFSHASKLPILIPTENDMSGTTAVNTGAPAAQLTQQPAPVTTANAALPPGGAGNSAIDTPFEDVSGPEEVASTAPLVDLKAELLNEKPMAESVAPVRQTAAAPVTQTTTGVNTVTPAAQQTATPPLSNPAGGNAASRFKKPENW